MFELKRVNSLKEKSRSETDTFDSSGLKAEISKTYDIIKIFFLNWYILGVVNCSNCLCCQPSMSSKSRLVLN